MSDRAQGARQINKNLEEFFKKKKVDISRGLKKAGQDLMGEAKSLVPVDTGNLRGTAYSQLTSQHSVQIGFTAEYAPWVHEMPMTLKGQPRADFGKTSEENGSISFGGGSGKGTYWSSGENKFLEKAIDRNVDETTNTIIKYARVE